MKGSTLVTALLVIVACVSVTSASAQPAGYHVGAAVVLPDSLVEVLARGRFRASVLRVAANASDARLIAAAEQLYPNPDAIIASATTADGRKRLSATAAGTSLRTLKVPQRPAGSPVDRWWLDAFDETWIPFAVTGSAVDYYLGRVHDYAAGRSPFGFSATDGADHGAFSYTARVIPSSEPRRPCSGTSAPMGLLVRNALRDGVHTHTACVLRCCWRGCACGGRRVAAGRRVMTMSTWRVSIDSR